MKKLFRAFAVCTTAVVGAASLALFAGCDTNYPEVTVTYEFLGKTYEVEYQLSRRGAPQTVQHFIELADAGYYDDTVIHDYQSNGLFLYGGGYTLDENGELVEKDYFSELRRLEKEEGIAFTQTVFANGKDVSAYLNELASDGLSYEAGGTVYDAESTKIPLYTLHGEFSDNGVKPNDKTLSHTQGTLAMYYTEKGSGSDVRVGTIRSDGGADAADGEEYQEGDGYRMNSATSLFYVFTSSSSRVDLNDEYATFGRTVDYSQLEALVLAVNDYSATLETNEEDEDGNPFTLSRTFRLNTYDPVDLVRNAGVEVDYNVPVQPIYVRSVEVTKY